MDSKQSPIIITGCARSGASLIAGVVNLCGGFGGSTAPKDRFENLKISALDSEYLKNLNLDPRGQFPLPITSSLPIPANWKQSVEGIISEEGHTNGPWFYKSAKTCLMWPIWNYAFPNAKWIVVRRRSADIADSCLKTSFMNAYGTYEEWIKWVNYYDDRFVEMIQAGLNVKQFWPERMVKGNYEQAYELVEWLGLNWKSEGVMSFVEPKLWKSRVKQGMKV
jgi:hypothetical protein